MHFIIYLKYVYFYQKVKIEWKMPTFDFEFKLI